MKATCEECGRYFLCYYNFKEKRVIGSCPCQTCKDKQTKLNEFGVE